jgi:hypothetical protein
MFSMRPFTSETTMVRSAFWMTMRSTLEAAPALLFVLETDWSAASGAYASCGAAGAAPPSKKSAAGAALAHAARINAATRTKLRGNIFFMAFSFSPVGDFSTDKDAHIDK